MTFEGFDLEKLGQELIALRREFHHYPESGWTEFRTTERIIEELEKLGLTVRFGPEIHVREKMFGLPKEEVLEMILRHARMLIDCKGNYTGIREMRKHVAWYTAGMKHSARLRGEVNETASYEELEALLTRALV